MRSFTPILLVLLALLGVSQASTSIFNVQSFSSDTLQTFGNAQTPGGLPQGLFFPIPFAADQVGCAYAIDSPFSYQPNGVNVDFDTYFSFQFFPSADGSANGLAFSVSVAPPPGAHTRTHHFLK